MSIHVPSVLPCPPRLAPQKVDFANGALRLAYPHSTYVVTPWPRFSVQRTTAVTSTCAEVHPKMRSLIFEFLESARSPSNGPELRFAAYEVVRALPTALHVRLVMLQRRYIEGLHFLAHVPEAAHLLDASPALFAIVASSWRAGRLRCADRAEIGRLCRTPQRQIVAALGWPATEATCKILRKFTACGLSHGEWLTIGRNLRSEQLRRALSHGGEIDRTIIGLLSLEDPLGVWTLDAKVDYCRRAFGEKFSQWKYDIIELRDIGELMLRYGLWRSRPKSLNALVDSARQLSGLVQDAEFPPGPALDAWGLQRIRTAQDLRAEGEQMGHCVGGSSYTIAALKGESSFYRSYTPERLTIHLNRERGRPHWSFVDAKGVKNAKPNHRTTNMLCRALESAGVLMPTE